MKSSFCYIERVIEINGGINPDLQDATSDLDGTVFKMTVLETYTEWLSREGVFDQIPAEIVTAKNAWKNDNTEQTYTVHLGLLVKFFVEQIPGKSVSLLTEAARIVAGQQMHRRWNVTTSLLDTLLPSHNLIAVSLMPEWLMKPFTEDLGFVALIGSTYVAEDGVYTGEAHSINKAAEYTKVRGGDTSKLDVHMGDTVGDSSLFALARRPVLFNPSWTLCEQAATKGMTIITSHKDVVTVINSGAIEGSTAASLWGPPFDARAILNSIVTRPDVNDQPENEQLELIFTA